MGNTRISNLAAKAALNAISALLTSGSTMQIRSGAAPAECEIANTGTLLATLNLPNPVFPSSSDGSGYAYADVNTVTPVNASATGIAGHFRVFNASAVCVMQGLISSTDGDDLLVLNNTSIFIGALITLSSWRIKIDETQ